MEIALHYCILERCMKTYPSFRKNIDFAKELKTELRKYKSLLAPKEIILI